MSRSRNIAVDGSDPFDSDDSVKDFVMSVEEISSESEDGSHTDSYAELNKPSTSKPKIKIKKTTYEKQHPKTTIIPSDISKLAIIHEVPKTPKRYLDYFLTATKDGGKFGICLICKGEEIDTNIKMKNSNTKGLKYHLSKVHHQEYNIFFGTGKKDPKQRMLTEMFGTKRKVQGATIADVDTTKAEVALKEIEEEFGPNKAIFVKTDVTDQKQFENAFKETVAHFKNLDILINNAGILNDSVWRKEIEINTVGLIYGMLLGLEHYIPKYKSGPEGVIVNISSIAGLQGYEFIPIYAGTKHAVIGMTRSWGSQLHYDRTGVKVLALCPGVTDTPLIRDIVGRNLGEDYNNSLLTFLKVSSSSQTREDCAKAMSKIIQTGETGSIWVAEDGKEAYEFIVPDRQTFAK